VANRDDQPAGVPVQNAEAFYQRLVASKPDPNTGKLDPAAVQAFLDRHPETVQAMNVIKGQPLASGFDNSTFHGLNAFRLVNSTALPSRSGGS